MRLVDITRGQPYRRFQKSRFVVFRSIIIRKRVVLPAPFGPITPTIPFGGRLNSRVSNRSLSPNDFAYFLADNYLITKPGSVRNEYFKFFLLLLHILIQKVFISAKAGFRFCMAGFWRHPNPFKFPFKDFSSFDIALSPQLQAFWLSVRAMMSNFLSMEYPLPCRVQVSIRQHCRGNTCRVLHK